MTSFDSYRDRPPGWLLDAIVYDHLTLMRDLTYSIWRGGLTPFEHHLAHNRILECAEFIHATGPFDAEAWRASCRATMARIQREFEERDA